MSAKKDDAKRKPVAKKKPVASKKPASKKAPVKKHVSKKPIHEKVVKKTVSTPTEKIDKQTTPVNGKKCGNCRGFAIFVFMFVALNAILSILILMKINSYSNFLVLEKGWEQNQSKLERLFNNESFIQNQSMELDKYLEEYSTD